MKLTINNLREVNACLYPVRRKWYKIGIELGLNVDELDTISANHRADLDECLIEMIKVWLRSIDPRPTWTALGDALRSAPINEVEQSINGTYRNWVCAKYGSLISSSFDYSLTVQLTGQNQKHDLKSLFLS
jgi:hypothetical protein